MTQTPISVAPSVGDGDRSNPLVLPPGGTFELRLDLPEGAHDPRETWELRSVNGRYTQRLTRSDAVLDPETEQMKVIFTGLYTDLSYSLFHHRGEEAPLPAFLEVPFAELTEHGSETSAPEESETDEIEDENDVQAESQHAEVQHDPSLDVLEIEDEDSDEHDELLTILAPPDEPEESDADASGLSQASTGVPGAPGASGASGGAAPGGLPGGGAR